MTGCCPWLNRPRRASGPFYTTPGNDRRGRLQNRSLAETGSTGFVSRSGATDMAVTVPLQPRRTGSLARPPHERPAAQLAGKVMKRGIRPGREARQDIKQHLLAHFPQDLFNAAECERRRYKDPARTVEARQQQNHARHQHTGRHPGQALPRSLASSSEEDRGCSSGSVPLHNLRTQPIKLADEQGEGKPQDGAGRLRSFACSDHARSVYG